MVKKKIKKSTPDFNIKDVTPYLSLAIRFSPIFVPILIIIVFSLAVAKPSLEKISKYNQVIRDKKNAITTVTRSKFNIEKTRDELANFKIKVEEFEKKLPKRLKGRLIIDTLQEVTKRADLRISSLKPAQVKKHILKETNDTFIELPVNVKLKCGYFELIDFIKNIEKADRLMKITSLTIKNDPTRTWEHVVDFSISTFSKHENDE